MVTSQSLSFLCSPKIEFFSGGQGLLYKHHLSIQEMVKEADLSVEVLLSWGNRMGVKRKGPPWTA